MLGALKSHPKMLLSTRIYKGDIQTLKLLLVESEKKTPNELQTGRAAFWGGTQGAPDVYL
jgi:hypothetical protein